MSSSEDLLTTDKSSIYSRNNEPWIWRTFSSIGKGSERGSILLLLLTALGTGIFTLHKIYAKTGFIIASILTIFVGFLLYYSSCLIIFSSKKKT